jgi:hypothetical protein
MAVLVLSLGITYAAVCVWLTVRIVKRRERCAKRSLAAVVSLPVLYVLSIGPVAWLNTRHRMPESVSHAIKHVYDPIDWLMAHSPKPFDHAIRWYAQLWYASPLEKLERLEPTVEDLARLRDRDAVVQQDCGFRADAHGSRLACAQRP